MMAMDSYQNGAVTDTEFQRLAQTIGTNIQKILQNGKNRLEALFILFCYFEVECENRVRALWFQIVFVLKVSRETILQIGSIFINPSGHCHIDFIYIKSSEDLHDGPRTEGLVHRYG